MKPNFENVKYGQLVEVLNDSGHHAGMKIHFFNKKGVLLGNIYEFVPYDKIRFRKDNYVWELQYLDEKFEHLKQFIYELKCRLITVMIRSTQSKSSFESLQEKYGFDKKINVEELIKKHENGIILNPIYEKHLPACWVIQDIWGHVMNENMSLGKARELTASVIEEHYHR